MYLEVSLLLKLLGSPHGGTDREAAKFLPLEIFRAELGKALSNIWPDFDVSPAWSGVSDWRSAELPTNLNYSTRLWKKLYRSWHYREMCTKCPIKTFSKPHKPGIITEFAEECMSCQVRPFQVIKFIMVFLQWPVAEASERSVWSPTINGFRITQPKEKFLPNPRQPVMGWCPEAYGLLSSLDLHLCSVTGDVLIAHAKDMFSWHTSEVIQSLLRPLLLKLSYCMPVKSLHHTILH